MNISHSLVFLPSLLRHADGLSNIVGPLSTLAIRLIIVPIDSLEIAANSINNPNILLLRIVDSESNSVK